jgi:parvulin-like peptidyl-prolyl isomerase
MSSQEVFTDASTDARIVVNAQDLILALKQLGRFSQTIRTAVYNQAVADLADENGVTPSQSDIQSAADEFRSERRLFSASETERWLNDHGMNPDDLEQLATIKARFQSLALLIPADAVEDYFSVHRAQFELVQISVIWVSDLSNCEELLMQVHEGADFQTLARRFSRHASAAEGGNLGLRETGHFDSEIADRVKELQPGETSRPLGWDSGFALIRLDARQPKELDERLSQRIRSILLDEQIQQRIRSCAVQVVV